MAINARAKKMIKEGLHIVNFGVGEPDFDTPENIKAAAEEALEKGYTKYTPVDGIDELKQAICEKLRKDNGLEYNPDQIVISNGAKHSLYNAVQVLVNPGDEVILPAPYWVSYAEIVKLAGGIPKVVNTKEENEFKLTAPELEEAINPRTKLLILNTPNNPTGSVYSKEELRVLSEVLVKNGIMVISDEIYEKLIFDNSEHVSIASLSPEIKEQTILVNGVSKSYSMTGWRIGYTASIKPVAKAMADIQSHATSNANSFAQWGALEALRGSQESIKKMVTEFSKRRDYIVKRLFAISGVTCNKPQGAFYAFPNISFAFGKSYRGEKIKDSVDLAKVLLNYGQIAVVPGIAFGVGDCLRFSYATSLKNIEEGLNRFEAVWQELK